MRNPQGKRIESKISIRFLLLENSTAHNIGFARAGGKRLRNKVFAKFEHYGFVESLWQKSPPSPSRKPL